jgi:hypothetical protein
MRWNGRRTATCHFRDSTIMRETRGPAQSWLMCPWGQNGEEFHHRGAVVGDGLFQGF